MAFGKTAVCLLMGGAMAAWGAQLPVRHEHLHGGCNGILTVDGDGIRFAGPKKHAWYWKYEDIQELKLEPRKVRIVTYKDDKLRLGADREYEFTGDLPAADLYQLWKTRMDQRFVAALPEAAPEGVHFPVKRLKRISGSEGVLTFGKDTIVYTTPAKGESRTWRYMDIDSISSSGPFELTITTFERARWDYGGRKGFDFALKQPIAEAAYNQLWLRIEQQNGRIQ